MNFERFFIAAGVQYLLAVTVFYMACLVPVIQL